MAIWQASRPTVIDLRIWERNSWTKGFKFMVIGKGRGPHREFGCYPVVALSFFCLLRLWDFRNFLIFALDCPFRVFTLESFFIFIFFLSFFDCPIMHSKIHTEQVNGLSRILAEDKRQQPSLITKNFLKEKALQSKYPRLIKMDFSGT